mgnify:CR=1 FL=1
MFETNSTEQIPNSVAATISDLKFMCLALLEYSNDKILALSHQKRANRILAAQICELEHRVENLQGSQLVMFPSQVLLEGYLDSDVKGSNISKQCSTDSLDDKIEKEDKCKKEDLSEK